MHWRIANFLPKSSYFVCFQLHNYIRWTLNDYCYYLWLEIEYMFSGHVHICVCIYCAYLCNCTSSFHLNDLYKEVATCHKIVYVCTYTNRYYALHYTLMFLSFYFYTEVVCWWLSAMFYRWSFATGYYCHTNTDLLYTTHHICDGHSV